MPLVSGILETSLYVDDLDASEAFYHRLFDWPTMLGDRRMRALTVAPSQVLLLFARGLSGDGEATPRGRIPGHDGGGSLHVAFAIEAGALETWQERLTDCSIEIISCVRPEQGGDSLYFRDPDGHLIELATPTIWDL